MNSKKNFQIQKKFSVLDAFKVFFLLLITMIAFSIILHIVLEIVASAKDTTALELQKTAPYIIISQILSGLIFIVFFFVYNKCVKIKNSFAISDGEKISLLPISIAMVLSIICIFLLSPFFDLLDYLFKVPQDNVPLYDYMTTSFPYFMIGVLIYCLLPAIGEELIFRGIILRGLSSRFTGFVSILISSILFALVHGSLQQTFYQLLMGILLGFLAYVGGSVIYSMILHFINNVLVLLFGCFDIVGYLSERAVYYNIFSMIFPVMLFLLGMFLIVVLMWVLRYLRNKNFFRFVPKKKKKKEEDEEVVVEEQKLGFKGLIKSLSYSEKLFIIGGLAIAFVIWLSNTITMFAN